MVSPELRARTSRSSPPPWLEGSRPKPVITSSPGARWRPRRGEHAARFRTWPEPAGTEGSPGRGCNQLARPPHWPPTTRRSTPHTSTAIHSFQDSPPTRNNSDNSQRDGRKQTTIRGDQESRKPDRRGWSCSEGELAGCVRENADQGWSGLCSWLLCHIDPFGCQQGSQFLRGKILERAPLPVEAGFEPQGDLVQLGRVDPPGQFGQLERIEVAESLPLPVQLHFHQQDGLLELGMGLGGAAEHQGLVAPGQPMMVIVRVQAKADQGGSDAARSCERLLRRDHLGVGLSRGDAQ